MDVQSTLYVQRVCGKFLYYIISVDQTMLAALNAITTAQAHSTTTTMGDIVWLLNYAATHPDATLHYHDSNMILHVTSDATYLCEERARSRDRDHFFSPTDFSTMAINHLPSPPTTAPYKPCASSPRLSCPQRRNPKSAPIF